MHAQVLHQPAPTESNPLRLEEIDIPQPGSFDLLLKIAACSVCHTDLHVVEGELPDLRLPVIPGHEIVGNVVAIGEKVTGFQLGMRVGIPWLHETCGKCEFCLRGRENLCPNAQFTGYTTNGGYAEYALIQQDFAVPLPEAISDLHAAPLLCAGIVGYRSIRLSELQPGERIGFYGFGASAHICIQIAQHWGCETFVFTRSEEHQKHAAQLGARWVGRAEDTPPNQMDRAIIFAPAGWIVPLALKHLRPAGTLCINAIHMSPIPEMPYSLLWQERTIRTVANATRRDASEFIQLAAEIPIRTDITTYDLSEANTVLKRLKKGEITGAAVLIP